jgi:thioredoxin 2
MSDKTVLLRCGSCAAINRLPAARLTDRPLCGKCKSQLEFPSVPVEATASNFDTEVLGWPGAVLVFFWAPWCAHCRGMFPIIDELAHRRAGILKVVRVNTEKEILLARRFDVVSVPRLALYRNGEKLNEINGAVQRLQLEEWLDYWT